MQRSDNIQWIATRELHFADSGNRRARIRIGLPQPMPDGDFECAYQITGVGDEKIRRAVEPLLHAHIELPKVRVRRDAVDRRLRSDDMVLFHPHRHPHAGELRLRAVVDENRPVRIL